jgi:hypothetical protein
MKMRRRSNIRMTSTLRLAVLEARAAVTEQWMRHTLRGASVGGNLRVDEYNAALAQAETGAVVESKMV